MNVHRWSTTPSRSILLLAGLLLGVALLLCPAQTVAQTLTDGPPTLVKHLRSELRAEDPERLNHALVDVTVLSHCNGSCTVRLRSIQDKQIHVENETGIGSVVDLEALTPDLFDRYRNGPADGHRLLALSALLHIGDEAAIERVVEEIPRQSKTVREASHARVAAFYLERYPELTDKVLRRKQLSLADVAKVKSTRMKLAERVEK